MRKFFAIFLRFSRPEQMGLVVLFMLVLAIIFLPKLFSHPADSDFQYAIIKQRIDSLTLPTDPPQTATTPQFHTTPAPKNTATTQNRQPYTPFTRQNLSIPMVELNTADTIALRLVRGVGAYYARSIVNYRERLGGYVHIQQLLELRNVDADRLTQWAVQLTVDTTKIIKINLTTADEQTLKQHPYIGYYAARGIIHFRTTQGVQACNLRALVENNILNDEVGERLKPYVSQ